MAVIYRNTIRQKNEKKRKEKKMRKKKIKTVSFREYQRGTGVHITTRHNGKMDGVWSLSTSCVLNPQCKKNAGVCGSICSKCYARNMIKMYSDLDKVLEKNTEILTGSILDVVPLLPCKYFRFEAFGDLMNETQFINYLNIAKYNPDTNCAIWSKNPHIIDNVFKQGYKKPKNLKIIISSLFINLCIDYSKIYTWCDASFTVYDKGYASQNNIAINCGGRCCATCTGGKCYKRAKSPAIINELLHH